MRCFKRRFSNEQDNTAHGPNTKDHDELQQTQFNDAFKLNFAVQKL